MIKCLICIRVQLIFLLAEMGLVLIERIGRDFHLPDSKPTGIESFPYISDCTARTGDTGGVYKCFRFLKSGSNPV